MKTSPHISHPKEFLNYCCPLKVFDRYKLGLYSSLGIQPFKLPLSLQNIIQVTMNKGTHFNGQPMYGQLISLLDKHEILNSMHWSWMES